MILGAANLLDHVLDTPWPGCQVEVGEMTITWMSNGIATMALVGILLMILIPWMARKQMRAGQAGGAGQAVSVPGGMIEVFVLFVRDQIAIPSLGKEKAHRFLPYLLTVFVFILGMNLIGMSPLMPITALATGHQYPVGLTPTGILTVCFALAALAMITITGSGLWSVIRHSRRPAVLAVLLAPMDWFLQMSPAVPGVIGKLLAVPLAFLEVLGLIAKCFALMIRLFSNMIAGHILLAVIMMFIIQSVEATVASLQDPTMANDITAFYISPLCIAGSVMMNLLELLVAGLQAYIYTFLSAMFLGLYVEPAH